MILNRCFWGCGLLPTRRKDPNARAFPYLPLSSLLVRHPFSFMYIFTYLHAGPRNPWQRGKCSEEDKKPYEERAAKAKETWRPTQSLAVGVVHEFAQLSMNSPGSVRFVAKWIGQRTQVVRSCTWRFQPTAGLLRSHWDPRGRGCLGTSMGS